MGILPRLIRSTSKYGPESDFWYKRIAMPTEAGVSVDEQEAIKYLTVYSCVSLIAGDVARLPLNMYRRRPDGGKEQITDHRLYDILHNVPNPEITSFNYRESKQGHLLLWGNTFDMIERDKQGRIVALWQIDDPSAVDVYREGGQILYKYRTNGREVIRTRDEVFHIPGFGFNGLYGKSMITLAREAIGMGMAAERYGARFFGTGTHPSGILTLPEDVSLGDQEEEYINAIREQYSGLGKSHSMMLLKNGETYKTINMSMEDAQFLQTRDHQRSEVCGMYHVPPHKVGLHGANSNYNNLEQENSSYVDSCLMHWITRWENCISQQLLSADERRSGLFFEFLVDGLLRGDSEARATHYNKLFQIGAITPNEIRAKENMNPLDVDEADQTFVMLNLIKLEDSPSAGELGAATPGKTEPDEDVEPEPGSKEGLRRFFMKTENRSIVTRDRIVKRYIPLLRDAAEAVVAKEARTLKSQIGKVDYKTNSIKNLKARRAAISAGLQDFIDDFYKDFPEYIETKMGPVLRALMAAISDEANIEAGTDADISDEVQDYIETFAKRYVYSSHGQLQALFDGDIDALAERVDEWSEKRSNKVVNDESVRASSAAYAFVTFAAGMMLRWRIRGKDTCPYCKSLNGERMAKGGAFVKPGQKIEPNGEPPMRVYGLKQHPPLHQGCDCYVTMF